MCTYLPGGRVAGQVPLHDSLEHQQKVDMMNDDNEYETDFLGNTGIASNNSKEDKKRPTKYAAAPERPPFVSEEDGNEGVETFSPMVMRMPSSRAEMTAFSPMALRLSSAARRRTRTRRMWRFRTCLFKKQGTRTSCGR